MMVMMIMMIVRRIIVMLSNDDDNDYDDVAFVSFCISHDSVSNITITQI